MYINNRKEADSDKAIGKRKHDIPDNTREIPFSKIPVPDVIDLGSTKKK